MGPPTVKCSGTYKGQNEWDGHTAVWHSQEPRQVQTLPRTVLGTASWETRRVNSVWMEGGQEDSV